MARKISHTLLLEGELIADTPLHIGGADTGHTSDMPLAVDGLGRYYLPGTSLAGAIRAWEGADDEDAVWGFAREDKGNASFLIIDDAPALDAPTAELWTGIGIHRHFGGASEGILFDRQVLPQGARFRFRVQREVRGGEEALHAARRAMGRLLVALEVGEVPIGGGTTRGFGRLSLRCTAGREIEWGNKAGILRWLETGNVDQATTCYWRQCAEREPAAANRIDIQIHWQPKGPLMSKAAREGMAVDMLPFVSRNRDGKDAMALPGSAIKGVLRQHAERIVRTVLGTDAKADAERHLDQVDVPLARELFGAAKPAEKPGKQATAARGLLAVDTCYANWALKREEWDALDTNAESWRTSEHPLYRADHVAIDRWTGGASEGALFSTVEPDRSIAWEPIRLRFDCRRRANLPALALLWLTLRDFAAGRLPLGFGVNRGYGDLAVSRIEIQGVAALGLDQDALTVTPEGVDQAPLAGLLKPAWTAWLAQAVKSTKEVA